MPHHMNPNYSAMSATGAVGTTTGTTMTSGIGLSDRDLMQIMLNEHKLMTSSMTNCILECAHPQLRQECINILNKNFGHQKMIWEAMNQRGWYNVQMASPQDVQRMQQQFSQPAMQQQAQTQPFGQQQPYMAQQQPYMQQNYSPPSYSSPTYTHMQRT